MHDPPLHTAVEAMQLYLVHVVLDMFMHRARKAHLRLSALILDTCGRLREDPLTFSWCIRTGCSSPLYNYIDYVFHDRSTGYAYPIFLLADPRA
jgi:hypothetical protein